jgi:uncharacterized protein (TIGR03067 family)
MHAPLVVALALAVGAPATKDKPPAAGSIEGSWAVESCLVGGQPDPGLAKAPIDRIEIGGGRWRVVRGVDRPAGTAITLDPRKEPAELTFLVPAEGEEKAGSVPGIYKVEGDRLTVCYDMTGPRPTTFESPAGSNVRLMVLTRVKKKD